jgi:hypothetical protein
VVEAETCAVRDTEPYRCIYTTARPEDVHQLGAELATSQRPLMIAGGSGWDDRASTDLKNFAEANHLPVAASFRRPCWSFAWIETKLRPIGDYPKSPDRPKLLDLVRNEIPKSSEGVLMKLLRERSAIAKTEFCAGK